MHTSRLLAYAALAASISTPLQAVELADLSKDLTAAGLQEDALPDLGESESLASALAGKRRTHAGEVAEGLAVAVYEGDGETAIVLATKPEKAGAYLLPGGERLAFRDLRGDELEPGSTMEEPVVFATSGQAWEALQYYTQLSPANPGPVEVTGADVDESVAFEVVRVSPGPSAFGEGLGEAQELLAAGKNVRVQVRPGLYREGELSLPGNLDDEDAPTLVIEGVGDGEAILTGADGFSGGWTEVAEHPGVWEKPWPHAFGMGGQPWARWGFLLPPEACRAELLTVDGELFLPVMLEKFAWTDPDGAVSLSEFDDGSNAPGRWEPDGVRPPGDLPEGAFGVVEAEGKIYARPLAGVDLNAAEVETGVRPQILDLGNRRNTVLRNLTFRHTAHHVGDAPDGARWRAAKLGGENLLVENCRFVENAAFGLSLERAATDVTIRGSAFNANGWKGLGGGFLPDNVLYENNESSSNNWRGHMGGEHSWDAAAVKVFGINSARGIAIRGHRSFANLTHGFWLDQSFVPYAPIQIEDSVFKGNLFGAELYLEKLTGPVELSRNVVWNSDGLYGVNGTSWNLRFRDNLLFAEGERPVWFLHKRGNESDYANASRDWTATGNTVVAATGNAAYVLQRSEPEQYAEFVETWTASDNTYARPEDARPFVGLDGEPLDFEGWKELTGEEGGSEAVPFDGYAVANHPLALSVEDQRRYEAARSLTERFLAVAAALEPASGPGFERVKQAVGNNAVPVPLAGLANRPLLGDDAWIGGGMQLSQLGGGRKNFAGVPFDVADPAVGVDAAVALQSQKVDGAESVEVPLGGSVEAVYVLHGAGWVGPGAEPFGRYEIRYADGGTHGVDVAANNPGVAEPLVGDWYPSFEPFNGEAVRYAKLRPDERGVGANLYVVEIVNPEPGREVELLRLSGDPSRDETLIVLGVTVLRP